MYNNFLKLIPFLLLLILCGACIGEQGEPSRPVVTREVNDEIPDQESWEAKFIITKDGRRVAEVWANYLAVFNRKKITQLKDSIHVDFFDSNGKHNSVLTADSGVVENRTKNLTATGNVIVVSDSGVVLETEKLLWDNKRQKIISNVTVKFTTNTDTLIGDSFISDPNLANYEIRNARGVSDQLIPIDK